MSKKQEETTHSKQNEERENRFDMVVGENEEENDVYARLAQKERDLILAAELGKALLDSNQELQSRYDQMADEFTRKVEELQQEKHDLHLELEKMETQYQNAIKDLQDDISVLRNQLQAKNEHQTTERERSRSLREAEQNSEYLMEQLKKASMREEELLNEIGQLKVKSQSSTATIQDQIDHITMLRDQVDYLSEKLREANQKLLDVQGERDLLLNTVEITQEKVQTLEHKISEQEEQIHRHTNDIEELQEANSELQQEIQQRQSFQYYPHQHRASLSTLKMSNRNDNQSNNTNNNNSSSGSKNTSTFTSQDLHHQPSPHTASSSNISTASPQQSEHQHLTGENSAEGNQQVEELKNVDNVNNTVEEEDSGQNIKVKSNTVSVAVVEFSSAVHHRRNISDCSVVSLTEGSRKRHHENICGGSDDDEDECDDRSSLCKQSLYSESTHHVFSHQGSPSTVPMDSNGNQPELSQFENPSLYLKDRNENSLFAELSNTENLNILQTSDEDQVFTLQTSSACNTHPPQETTSSSNINPADTADFAEDMDENDHLKSLFSELSPFAHEFYPRNQVNQEQSLFSELSSQLFDDRQGSGSDSSSNCMLGAFDFNSGYDSQDADHFSNESLNHSMEMRSRIESDMSYVSDWYYMTPVTSEMLEEDDFECDDDDFLMGNMAGTTLSITDACEQGPSHYQYPAYSTGEVSPSPVVNTGDDTPAAKHLGSGKAPELDQRTKQDAQLSEACRQLKDLVAQVRGQSSAQVDPEETSLDVLLSLISEMRLCVNQLTTGKTGQVQGTDVSTSVNSLRDSPASVEDQIIDSMGAERGHSQVVCSSTTKTLTVDSRLAALETPKQMKKSKSSSSLASKSLL